MAVIDQYKQIQEDIGIKKQAKDRGYIVDRANKTIGAGTNSPITEEQRKQITAKGWNVIDTPVQTNPVQPTQIIPNQQNSVPVNAPQTMPVNGTNTPQPITQPAQPNQQAPTPGVTMDSNTGKPYEAPKIEQPKLTPEQEKIQTNLINKFNSNLSLYSTGDSLYKAVQGGSILPGTQEFTDLTTRNPRVLEEYNALKTQNERNNTVKVLGQAIVGEPVQPPKSNTLEQLVSYFTKGMGQDIAGEYKNTVTNNPAYQSAVQNFNGINQQIADNNKNITALREDVRKKYSAGTPESLIASAIAREARPLIEQGQYLSQLQANAQAEMTRIFDENKQGFELKQQQIQNNMNRAFQLYGTIRAEEIRQEDIIRADEEIARKMKQAKTEQEYNQYKDEREYNLKVAEAKIKAGQWQSEYDLKASEAGKTKASDYLKFEVENEDGSKTTIYRNPTTGQEINPKQAFGSQASANVDLDTILSGYSQKGQQLLTVPDGTVVPTRLGQVSPQNAEIRGKECAEYVNDIAGTKMGNTYNSKLAVCNEPTGGVGSVVAWKPNGSGEFGHTGIIVGQDQNNWYVKSSNYVPGTVTTEKIPKSNIQNFYTPDSVKQAQTQQEPKATRYANGNVRTADGTLYTNKEVATINKDIIKNDNYKAILTSQDLNDKLNQFEEVFNKYGTEVGLDKLKFNRTGATALQNTYTSLLLTAKEFFNLGVLNGPDLAILTAGMPSPVDFELPSEGGRITKVNGTFLNSKIEEGIKQMRAMIQQKLQRDYNTVSQSFGEFGDTLPALKNARSVYESFSPEMDDVNSFLTQ